LQPVLRPSPLACAESIERTSRAGRRRRAGRLSIPRESSLSTSSGFGAVRSRVQILTPRGKLRPLLGLPQFARNCKHCSLLLRSGLDSSCLQSAARDSAAPGQIHDGGPYGRRQTMPIRNKLLYCRVTADIVQPLAPMIDANIMLRNGLRNRRRGCNSCRLHLVFQKSLFCKYLRLQETRVCYPRPPILGVTHDWRGLTESPLRYPFPVIHLFGSRIIPHSLGAK